LGEGRCTHERLLPVGSHDGLPGDAAGRRVADTSPVFVDDPGPALGIAPGPPRNGLDQHLNLARSENGKKTQTEKTTKLPNARVTFTSTATTGGTHGQPDLVAGSGAIDGLQHEVEREGEFEFADNDCGRLTLAQRHQITTAHLALDLEAQLFEEALNRQVEA